MSSSGSSAVGNGAKMARRDIRESLPKSLYCPNLNCMGPSTSINNGKYRTHSKYCDICGKELESRIADVYIDLKYDSVKDYKEDKQSPNTEESPKQPQETGLRVGMREFIRMLKAYEEEMFVEGI